MGLGAGDIQVGPWNAGKSKGKKKKNSENGDARCWIKLSLMGSCLSPKAKVDGSRNDTGSPYAESKSANESNDTSTGQPVVPVMSSSTTTNAESSPSTPNISEELKVASQLRKFSFNDLKLATRSFRPENLLGEGGFGCVFKGWINEKGNAPVKPGTGLSVAVKTLNHDGLQGHREWLAEVNYLGALLHPNLVKLTGYCIEDDQRLLVYEFMPRGSLENHLFRRSMPLPWSTRMKIALGAAKGLAFLHEEAERPVIYRDFKSSNILLDADYNAKLSDFGLAKDGPDGDKTHVSTRVMGTYGYAAPEYVMTGHLTSKSDVYSFGVVLLEMLTGRRSMDKNRPNGEHNLVEWARPYLGDRRRFYRLIDPRLEGRFSIKGAQKAIQLAAHCLSRDQKARPLMSEVVEVLKPLPNLKDMACTSSQFQAIHVEQMGSASKSRTGGNRVLAGLSLRNGQPTRSLSALDDPYSHLFITYDSFDHMHDTLDLLQAGSWIGKYVLRGDSFCEAIPAKTSSWSWKKLIQLRDLARTFIEVKNGVEVWRYQGNKYMAAKVWKEIRPKQSKISWCRMIWASPSIPKHAIIAWMAILDRLPTKDRLATWGLEVDVGCVLCEREVESRDHIFFGCCYSKAVWKEILKLCGLERGVLTWNKELSWAVNKLKARSLILMVMRLA
ncbi:hypothetical protein DITRI_Ditri16bG0117100 [Diplodiscus trichospermus]